MELARRANGGVWRRSKGLLAVVCAAAVFVGIASVIKPDPRGAAASAPGVRDGNLPGVSGAPTATLAASVLHPTKGWRLIGTLEGREHVLKCWATPDGPRYSVHTLDGRVIQDELPADEVYRGFPDIDLPNLHVDPPEDQGFSGSGALNGARGLMVDFVDSWRE